MTLSEKVAYLKGLAEGLGIDPEKSKEGKLIAVMMDILEDVAVTLSDLEDDVDELGEALDTISDDLSEVEDALFDEDEEEDDDDEDDGDFFELECPSCKESLVIDSDVLEQGSITCPGCGKKLAFDLGGCECGCCGEEDDGEVVAQADPEDKE